MKFLHFSFAFLLYGVISVQSVFADFTIVPVTVNSDDAIDIVFVGDGFTEAQQSVYNTRVNSAKNFLFDNLPFSSRQSDFNIYSVPTVSNESGISVQGGTQVDTALKTFLNANNLPRLTGIPTEVRDELTQELKKVFKKTIYPIVIMNTPTYGGSGSLNDERYFMSMTQVTLDGQYGAFRELLVHEFGHSFGELADEYGGNCSYTEVSNWDFDHYNRKNVTYDNVNDRKWDTLVANPQYFLGANYCDNQWYRSSNSGIMRSLVRNSGHNALGQILISQRIDEEIAYNEKVETYQIDGVMELPDLDDRNIRIHADESILEENLQCDNLYVAEFSELVVRPDVSIECNSMTVLGTIIYEERQTEPEPIETEPKKKTAKGVRYGCKDPLAVNYNYFSRHRQSFCIYDQDKPRPPHYISDDYELSVHDHDHDHE